MPLLRRVDAVSEAFVRLYDKGLVYKSSYLVNWSPNLQTAVSDLEVRDSARECSLHRKLVLEAQAWLSWLQVEYTEEEGKLYTFRYPVAGGDESLPVATSRPETILGDTAVAVNPEDDRFKRFIGQECIVPLSGGR